jgi:hypothetical protein
MRLALHHRLRAMICISPPCQTSSRFTKAAQQPGLNRCCAAQVNVNGQAVLLFWYRNQIYAISSRSPAEGAYSEGFIKAKFTQARCGRLLQCLLLHARLLHTPAARTPAATVCLLRGKGH